MTGDGHVSATVRTEKEPLQPRCKNCGVKLSALRCRVNRGDAVFVSLRIRGARASALRGASCRRVASLSTRASASWRDVSLGSQERRAPGQRDARPPTACSAAGFVDRSRPLELARRSPGAPQASRGSGLAVRPRLPRIPANPKGARSASMTCSHAVPQVRRIS